MEEIKTEKPKLKMEEKLKDKEVRKEIKVLGDFVEVYCRKHHNEDGEEEKQAFRFRGLEDKLFKKKLYLCKDCTKLLAHGIGKRIICPYDPKPMCKKCETHCYKPFYREKIREVMKFSGIYLVKHGRLDLIYHYYF